MLAHQARVVLEALIRGERIALEGVERDVVDGRLLRVRVHGIIGAQEVQANIFLSNLLSEYSDFGPFEGRGVLIGEAVGIDEQGNLVCQINGR